MYRKIPKHSYLCKILPDINPRVIDFMVTKELSLIRDEKIEELTLEPEYSELSLYLRTSIELAHVYRINKPRHPSGDQHATCVDSCPLHLEAEMHFLPFEHSCPERTTLDTDWENTSTVKLTRQPGITYLRKIFKNLNKSDCLKVMDALSDLKDIIEDKNECFEALKHSLVARLDKLSYSKSDHVREGCATLISIIAELDLGQMAIYSSPASLHNLALHITDKNIWIRYKAIRTLHYLVSTSRGADSIIKAGFIPFLIKRLLVEEREMIGVILNILRTLLQRDVKRLAIQLGILPTLIHFVFDEFYDISSFAQDCLELVLTESNVKATIDSECLTFLKTRRYETDRETSLKSVQVYNILSASTFLRKKIAEPEIIDQILNVSWKFKTDNQIVLLCFKTLFNLCEVPIARRILERRKYFIINVFLPLEKRFRNLSMLCE